MSATSTLILPRFIQLTRDIKLSHSIFALPFALLAAFLAAASANRMPNAATLSLVVICMVLARTVAMTINRWADAALDAANQRTQHRAIPSGRITPSFALGTAIICAGLFIVATTGFWVRNNNPWPMMLAPVVLVWICVYSFTKRVTSLSHLYLGSALAISPLAAVIAVQPGYLGHIEPYLLAMMVMCWVAGFDVIYALQDIEPDRRLGLHSLPAKMGAESALWCSRALHVGCFCSLVLLAITSPTVGPVFASAVVIVALLLLLEHALVWRSKTHHIHLAFFTVNGLISLLLGAVGIFETIRSIQP